jgi:hypothetical protein
MAAEKKSPVLLNNIVLLSKAWHLIDLILQYFFSFAMLDTR